MSPSGEKETQKYLQLTPLKISYITMKVAMCFEGSEWNMTAFGGKFKIALVNGTCKYILAFMNYQILEPENISTTISLAPP